MFLLKWSRQDTLEHLKNVLPLNESENYSTTDLSRLPTDPDFRFSASSQTCCGHHMNCGNIFLLTSEGMQDFSVCRKSKCHTHTQKFPAWILIQFTKKKEVEKRVSRLDCSKSTFIQSDYIINWLPNSFYSGLFQTCNSSGWEASNLPWLPLHHSEACCIISIIMGSSTPSWTWQVNSSNKILKASILVIANNLNNFCSNHGRKFLQLSYLSWAEEGKKERAGEWGWCFFPPPSIYISQNSTSAHSFSTIYLVNTDSLALINITQHLLTWFNDSGAKKLYVVSNYRRTDLHTQFQNHTG